MNRKQRRAKRKQPVKTNHNMTIQLAKARDLKTLAHRVESDRQRVSQVYGEEVSCLYEDELRRGGK